MSCQAACYFFAASAEGVGCEVVFELDVSGVETVLHNFTGGADGASPIGRPALDSAGHLYGTAQTGRDTNCYPSYGCGVAFKLAP